jgi:hypothetical protein
MTARSIRRLAVRWEALFADLEARAAAFERAERDVEIADRTRVETAAVRLCDRLAAALGRPLRLRCVAGFAVTGRLAHVGSDWLLVDEGSGREALVALAAVIAVSGVGRHAVDVAADGVVATRLGVRHALRGIARDRSVVRVGLMDGTTLVGTIDRVGQDYVDLAVHPEIRRRREVVEFVVAGVHALVTVRRGSS